MSNISENLANSHIDSPIKDKPKSNFLEINDEDCDSNMDHVKELSNVIQTSPFNDSSSQ